MDGNTVIRSRNVVNGVWRPDSAMTEEQKMDRSQAGIILPGHAGVLSGAMSAESRFKDYDSYLRAVKEIPWVFASVSLLAYSFATAPGDWYENDEPITDIHDPLLKLWARPNPRQSGMVFRELMAMYIELAGEAYISLEEQDASGQPGELYLPNPARMRIVQNKIGDIIGYVYDTTGFHYDGRIPPPFVPYFPEEIIHIKTANPLNEMRGLGNIEAMETTMNIMAAMTGNELSYWQSGGRITGVLETDQQVDEDTFDRLVQRWRQFTADKRQRFKTAILEQGLKYTPVAEGFKGLDYTKLDTSKRDFVLANFGIPKNKLGIIEDAQYKSDEADRFFWSETMEPRLTRFEDHIQPLGDVFGTDRYYRFERRNFEDDTVKLNNAMVMRSLKAFTTNEIRVYIGVPEVDGDSGETIILQQTDVVVTIDKLADADTTAGAAGGGPPSTTPPDQMPPGPKPSAGGGHSPVGGVSPEGNGNENGRTGAVDSNGHLPNVRNVHNAAEQAASKNAPKLPDEKTLARLTEEERNALIQRYDRDVKAAQAVARGLRARGYKVAGKTSSLTRLAVYAEKTAAAKFETKAARTLPAPAGASITTPAIGERIRQQSLAARRELTTTFTPKLREAFAAQRRSLTPTISKMMKITNADERLAVLKENFPRGLAGGPSDVISTLHAEAANEGWRTAKRAIGFSPKTSADFEAKAATKGRTPLMNPMLEQRYQSLPDRRITGVDDTTITRVNDMVTEGLRRGYSPLQVASGVPDENFDGIDSIFADDYRSEMIARTESMFAYDWGTTNAFVDSGLRQVEALDNGTDPECVARNGETYDLDPITGRAVDGDGQPIEDHPNGTLVWLPTGDFSNLVDTGALDTMGLDHWDSKFARRHGVKGYMERPHEEYDSETVLIAKNRMTLGRGPHHFEAARFTHPNGHPRCLLCGQEETMTGMCPGSDFDGGKWIHLDETKGDVVGHPFHGNQFVQGAGTSGVAFHASLGTMIDAGHADEAARQLKENGGFTYSLNEHAFHNIGQPGFGVSPFKDREKVIEGNATRDDILRYAMANSDVLGKSGMHIGGWVEQGKSYLDISKVVGSEEEAHAAARSADQLAIFDFSKGQSIPTKQLVGKDAAVEEEKGEASGHPFRGNQYTQGQSGDGPVRVSSIEQAIQLLGEGKGIMFERPDQAVTLLHELSKIAQEAKAAGQQAKTYDLCKVSVANTNLFCAENVGIPRSAMPQLVAKPTPGSMADHLPKNEKGEVDLTQAFRDYLTSQGHLIMDTNEFASHLRASQTEMNGIKVAGMMEAIESGKLRPAPIFVSDDNYVIDGHHRWAANVGAGLGDKKEMVMPVARINMKILPALAAANQFASSMGIPQAGVEKGAWYLVKSAVAETKPAKVKGKRGEGSGHPFHGNRWTGSLGSAADTSALRAGKLPVGKSGKTLAASAELKGLTPETATANLVALYDRNATAVKDGAWYADAHDTIGDRAAAAGVDPQLYTAVVAATSPQMAWDVHKLDGTVTYPNLAAADKVVQISKDFAGQDPAGVAKALQSPGMLRMSLENGLRVMAGESPDKVLGGPKIRSFYNNLAFPDQTNDTTVDTHMARALANNPMLSDQAAGLLTSAPNRLKSGAIGKGANGYGFSADAIRAAAEQRGVSAARMQAATWVQWRRENPYQGRREHV